MKMRFLIFVSVCIVCISIVSAGSAQTVTPTKNTISDSDVSVPDKVDITPLASDQSIANRLANILEATGWFKNTEVQVRDGVVFLDGQTAGKSNQEWAGDLARKTQDVVAVVNRIEVIPELEWNFTPAWLEIKKLWLSLVQAIPLILFAFIVIPVAWLVSRYVARFAGAWLNSRVASPLLSRIIARSIAIPIFLLGCYLVLQVTGLTSLALTIIGGTGVAGIVFGFAFRDIAENFLASLLLSIRRPFQTNDVIIVDGQLGLVREMNTRSTVLMTSDGNHVQVPNAKVFKSTIINKTANPNARAEFIIGIGYDNSIRQAQDIISDVLGEHPAVLDDPEHWILVDELGSSAVILKAYFWFDLTSYSEHKVRSALLRQSLRQLEKSGITAPDDAREIIFPEGVPIVGDKTTATGMPRSMTSRNQSDVLELDSVSEHEDEGGLISDTDTLLEQAKRSRSPEEGQNLLG